MQAGYQCLPHGINNIRGADTCGARLRCLGTVSGGHIFDTWPACDTMAGLTRRVLLLALAAASLVSAGAQSSATTEEDFRVYTDHPRIFLGPQRLRLLKRERERKSMRWEQFDALVRGGAPLKEPGFALALYYAVTGETAAGQKAIEWAATASDLHQLAIVFDWCQPLLGEAQRRQLASRIVRLNSGPEREDTAAQRDRVLAAIAVADEDRDGSERILGDVVRHWWREQTAPRLASGDRMIGHDELYALEEILHAIRDNLKIDLRDNAGDYFTRVPLYELASYYPAPFQEHENDCYIPAFAGGGQPNLRRAILSRIADMSLVAYDSNAQANQYVQGWVMQDRFMLRDSLGAPWEFLWGNPYQPGLSYYQLPLAYHDTLSGALFLRSSWDDDAKWFGLVGPEMQLFDGGKLAEIRGHGQIAIGDAQVIIGHDPLAFESAGDTYISGLLPQHPYFIEADDEEMQELDTDRRGTLALELPKDRRLHVLVHGPK